MIIYLKEVWGKFLRIKQTRGDFVLTKTLNIKPVIDFNSYISDLRHEINCLFYCFVPHPRLTGYMIKTWTFFPRLPTYSAMTLRSPFIFFKMYHLSVGIYESFKNQIMRKDLYLSMLEETKAQFALNEICNQFSQKSTEVQNRRAYKNLKTEIRKIWNTIL